MGRLASLHSLKDHAWYRKLYDKMTSSDHVVMANFIKENQALNFHEFEKSVNRMFLDKEKPKSWKEISELLSVANKLCNN